MILQYLENMGAFFLFESAVGKFSRNQVDSSILHE